MINTSSQKSGINNTLSLSQTQSLMSYIEFTTQDIQKTKLRFIQWFNPFTIEERNHFGKVNHKDLSKVLRKCYRRLFSETCQEFHIQVLQKTKTSNEEILSRIVLSSQQDYLDTITFEYDLLQNPEALYNLLFVQKDHENSFSNPETNTTLLISLKAVQQSITLKELSEFLRQYMRNELFQKIGSKVQGKNIKASRIRKKQLTNFWKDRKHIEKWKILTLGHEEIKSLLNKLIEFNIYLKPQQIEKEIQFLLKLDKNDFSNHTFTSKLNSRIQIEQYHGLIYENLKKETQKIILQMFEINKSEDQSQSLGKALDLLSNQTNQTDDLEVRRTSIDQIAKLRLNEDILNFSDKISIEANQYFYRKIEAFKRIEYLLLCYFQANITLFGSSACGLSIKNSDIDILVNSDILLRFDFISIGQRVIYVLERIAQVLALKPYVTNLKVLKKAHIPIIKLQIDTSIQMSQQWMSYQDYYNLNSCQDKGIVEIDLTIGNQDCILGPVHLGIVSTLKIKQWLAGIENLHEIALILKYYLTILKLNDTYTGGVKTYVLIILVAAFILHRKKNNPQYCNDIQSLFEDLTKFYGWDFDEKNFGIDILSQNDIFFKKIKIQSNGADLLVKDPINGEVMTKNCYMFDQFRQMMRELYIKCFQQTKKEVQKVCNLMGPKIQTTFTEQVIEKVNVVLTTNHFSQLFT